MCSSLWRSRAGPSLNRNREKHAERNGNVVHMICGCEDYGSEECPMPAIIVRCHHAQMLRSQLDCSSTADIFRTSPHCNVFPYRKTATSCSPNQDAGCKRRRVLAGSQQNSRRIKQWRPSSLDAQVPHQRRSFHNAFVFRAAKILLTGIVACWKAGMSRCTQKISGGGPSQRPCLRQLLTCHNLS